MCSLGRRRQGRHDGDPPAPLHAYARLAQQQGGALSSSRHIVVSRGRAQRSTHTSLPRACDGIFPRRTLGAAARVHSRGVGGARGQGFRPRSEAVPQLEPTLHPRLHLRQSAVHEVRTRQRPSHLPAPLHLRGRLFPSHRRDLPHGRRSARTLGSHGRRVGLGTRQRQSVVTSPALKKVEVKMKLMI